MLSIFSTGNNSTVDVPVNGGVEVSSLGNDSCNPGHGEGIRLVSLRWQEVGVYYTITAFVIIAGFTKLGKSLMDKMEGNLFKNSLQRRVQI